MATRGATSPPVDLDRRWRPDGDGPACGFDWDGSVCDKSGPHYCEPRGDKAVGFFRDLLKHTKGPHKRKPFVLKDWQEWEIVRPLFGEVRWTDEWGGLYVRRYTTAHIVVARKNGKSELAAGIQLYLLVADDEESAEVYSAAKDTKQAAKVFEPARRMAQLEPELNGFTSSSQGRLGHNKNARRLYDEDTNSIYEIITADALGELGHNPHGFNLDEVLSQPDATLWEAMTTAEGARAQPLFFSTTTETNDPSSFGAGLIDEAERVQEDPSRAPHVFAWVRKLPRNDDELDRLRDLFPGHPDLPVSTDPFDEANWKWANPALDDFKSRETMRRQALDATNEPSKENGFRQYQVNQRVSQVTRYMPMHLWDGCVGDRWASPEWGVDRLLGESCVAGLDLSARHDLSAWSLLFDDGRVMWRFWVPDAVIPELDRLTSGQLSVWVRDGWVTATDGDVIDYDAIVEAIGEDAERFAIRECHYDKWSGEPVRQRVEQRTGLEMFEADTTFSHMTLPMKELLALAKSRGLAHGGNPVARWMADSLEAKSPADDPDRLRPVKPERHKSGKRIDGMVTLLLAIKGRLGREEAEPEPFVMFG